MLKGKKKESLLPHCSAVDDDRYIVAVAVTTHALLPCIDGHTALVAVDDDVAVTTEASIAAHTAVVAVDDDVAVTTLALQKKIRLSAVRAGLVLRSSLKGGLFFIFRLLILIIIIIYHDFLPTPRRVSHVKSDKTHTQSSRYTP